MTEPIRETLAALGFTEMVSATESFVARCPPGILITAWIDDWMKRGKRWP